MYQKRYVAIASLCILLLGCALPSQEPANPRFKHEPVGETPEDIGLWITKNTDYVADKTLSLHAMIRYKGDIYEYNGFKASGTKYYKQNYGEILYELTFERAIEKTEQYGTWQSPRETYRKATGDCEDLAVLFAYFLWEQDRDSQGKDPKILLVTVKEN